MNGLKLEQIRWDSVAKIGAGALLAVAIATSAPSLLGSEQPKPLEPDVGLPQAALPSPAPQPPAPPPQPKRMERKPAPKPAHPRGRHRRKPARNAVSAAQPVAASPLVTVPSGSGEDFGFERP